MEHLLCADTVLEIGDRILNKMDMVPAIVRGTDIKGKTLQ